MEIANALRTAQELGKYRWLAADKATDDGRNALHTVLTLCDANPEAALACGVVHTTRLQTPMSSE